MAKFGSQELRDQIHERVVESQMTPVQRLQLDITPDRLRDALKEAEGQYG